MRLTDFLSGPAARQVQYYPKLVPILGSVTATILFGQLLYWVGKEADVDGWIFKSQAEISEETALTREEQESARKKLRDAGVLREQKKGIPCRLWFILDLDHVNDLWEKYQQNSQYGQKPQTRMRGSRKQACGNAADKNAAMPQAITLDYTIDYSQKNNNNPVVASCQCNSPQILAVVAAIPPQQRSQKLLWLISQNLEAGKTVEHLVWRIEKAHQKAAKSKVWGYLRKDLEALLNGEDWHTLELEADLAEKERHREAAVRRHLDEEAANRERQAELQRQAQLLQRLELLPLAEQDKIKTEAERRCLSRTGVVLPGLLEDCVIEVVSEELLSLGL